jgi:LCP family protein required for cell wall assembly
MRRTRLRFLLIFEIIGVLIVSALVVALLSWRAPLAAKLHVPTFAANATMPFEFYIPPAPEISGPTSVPTSAKPTVCNRSDTMYILAIGEDYRGGGGDYLYNLSDVIRIVRVDFSTPSVSVLAIPRDLWVHIPELSDQHIDYGKINQAYFFGTPGMGHYDGPGGGAGLLADTLYYNFGIFPDHYVDVSMNAFAKIVDAVGGIDVTLTKPVDGDVTVDGETQHLGVYPADTYYFGGATALNFARIRYGYPDSKRIDDQTILIKALYDKITSSSANFNLLGIANTFVKDNTVLTDLSPADVSDLYCLSKRINTSDIKLMTLPSDSFTVQIIFSPIQNNYVSADVPDTAKVIQYLRKFMDGNLP